MNALMPRTESSYFRKESIETLAGRHFEQVFAFFHAFHDDPATCLELSEQAFRLAEGGDLSTHAVFAKAAQCLSRRPGLELPIAEMPYENNVAWLLKEISDLRYQEIGDILGLGAEDIKRRISEVRNFVVDRLDA